MLLLFVASRLQKPYEAYGSLSSDYHRLAALLLTKKTRDALGRVVGRRGATTTVCVCGSRRRGAKLLFMAFVSLLVLLIFSSSF